MSLLTGSANYIKYVLLAFNIIFLLTGVILIAVGVGVAATFSEYELFLVSKFFSIPTFLIVTGAFIIFISFFGCWGSLRENYCLTLVFSVLLGVIFIFELSGGISGYVLRGNAETLIKGQLNDSLVKYTENRNTSTESMWDYIQRKFDCCGISNYTDWQPKFGEGLPSSCCSIPVGAVATLNCTANTDDPNLNAVGCLTEFSDYIAKHAVSLGAAGIVIAIIQFFGVLFSCYVAREIKIRNGITGWI